MMIYTLTLMAPWPRFHSVSPLCLVFNRLSNLNFSPSALNQLRLDQILKKHNGAISEDFQVAKEPEAAGLFHRNPDLILSESERKI